MDTDSIVIRALVAGAAKDFRPNLVVVPETHRPMYDAYSKLKEILREDYPQVEVDLLDIAPDSDERQQRMAAQLEASGALSDESVRLQAETFWQVFNELSESDLGI